MSSPCDFCRLLHCWSQGVQSMFVVIPSPLGGEGQIPSLSEESG